METETTIDSTQTLGGLNAIQASAGNMKPNLLNLDSKAQSGCKFQRQLNQASVTGTFSNLRARAQNPILMPMGMLSVQATSSSVEQVRPIANQLVNQVIPKSPKGWTFSLSQRRQLNFGLRSHPELYIVSRFGHERCFDRCPSRSELEEWLVPRWESLRHPNTYIGNWSLDGQLIFDISVSILGYQAAVLFGQLNRQQAIYHPASGRSLSLN